MRQFTRFKSAHPDCLLFFRMGDFYELFGPDAEAAHRLLGITLTERTKGMPMAGVPHHAAENYLRRLVEQGIPGRGLRSDPGSQGRQGRGRSSGHPSPHAGNARSTRRCWKRAVRISWRR